MTFILCWPPEPEEWWWGIQWIEPSWALHLQRNEDEWWQQPRVSRVTRHAWCDVWHQCTVHCSVHWLNYPLHFPLLLWSAGQALVMQSCSMFNCSNTIIVIISLRHCLISASKFVNYSSHIQKYLYNFHTALKLPNSSSVDYIGQCVCWLWGDGWWWWGGRVIRLIHTPPPA